MYNLNSVSRYIFSDIKYYETYVLIAKDSLHFVFISIVWLIQWEFDILSIKWFHYARKMSTVLIFFFHLILWLLKCQIDFLWKILWIFITYKLYHMSTYREKYHVVNIRVSKLRTGIPKNKQTGLTNKFYITCKMRHKISIDRMKIFSIPISTRIEYFKKV